MDEKQRYFAELAFDGTRYHGWQIQQNALSVQEVFNKALQVLLRQPIETVGCGRTDTGVHAKQLFVHFDVAVSGQQSVISEQRSAVSYQPSVVSDLQLETRQELIAESRLLTSSLNAILPKDIAVKNIIPVPANAHARFDATLRAYEYHIHFGKDPFKQNYSWQLRDFPDLGLMNQAANIIKEYRDFSCFSKSNTQVKTNFCMIKEACWMEKEDGLVFHISADRFLRNMVRAIVGTLIAVGKKEIKPEAVRSIIESKNRSKAGVSVPACGLYLTKVVYPYIAST
ncbi:tRNA pseudouridine(38-40) synthase TruA [uncultured Mucilaginibacter sp.]|uniref:tRNA pseudouridine(38-40) synthase TruA n=1 Tax=uncultured Mucilaginibacter sp. TaxID=797541 RepID=UPI00260D06CE|nr:tRNA pseudouridine(38-40) synthase TruA [uncultured Mucilaginibacter sp.]